TEFARQWSDICVLASTKLNSMVNTFRQRALVEIRG
ncbi:unnamed protein product, partial [Didymodactylos carnosus]